MARKKSRTDGRLQKSFTFEGKRYYVYGRTQKELTENMEQKKTDLREGRYVRSENLTMDQYFERWEKNREGTVKPATIRNQHMWYQALSKIRIDKAGTTFGSLRLTEIEKQNVVDLQAALKACRQKDGSRKFNTNTINSYVNLVKSILKSAVDDEILNKNVAKSVKTLQRTEPKARETIHRALSVEETKRFMKAAAESWYLNHFKFMLYSGCRCGETGALRYSDVNYTDGRIEIRRTITKNEIGGYEVGDSAKTEDGIRDIPLTDPLKEAIQNQKLIQSYFSDGSMRFDRLIFTSPEGQLLNDTSLNREIARICKAAGIKKFTAHAFRDTFATRAIESNMNPKTLQEILGHADIRITMNLYCHVMEETKVNEMNNINIAI